MPFIAGQLRARMPLVGTGVEEVEEEVAVVVEDVGAEADVAAELDVAVESDVTVEADVAAEADEEDDKEGFEAAAFGAELLLALRDSTPPTVPPITAPTTIKTRKARMTMAQPRPRPQYLFGGNAGAVCGWFDGYDDRGYS